MVPISAHALFARPLVISPTSTVAVDGAAADAATAVLCCDGRRTLDAAAGRPGRGPPRRAAGPAGPAARRCRSPTGWWPSSGCRCTAGAVRPGAARALSLWTVPALERPEWLRCRPCCRGDPDPRPRRHRGRRAGARPRPHRGHRRDRRRQDHGRHRAGSALRRPGRPGAGADRRRAAPWSRGGCGSTGRRAGVLARAVEAGAEVDEDGELLVSPDGLGRGPVPGAPRRPRRAGRPARRAGRATCWPCTGSRTSCACSRRPSSAPPWTGTPGAGSPSRWRRYRAAYGGWRAVADDLADRTAQARERAQEADLLRSGSTRSPRSSRSRARTTSCAAEAERLGARRGAARRPRRPRTRRWPATRTTAADGPTWSALLGAGPARPGRAVRRRPGAGGAGRPAGRGRLPGRATSPPSSPAYAGSARRRPGRGWPRSRSGGPRCGRLTRKYGDAKSTAVLAWAGERADAAGRAGRPTTSASPRWPPSATRAAADLGRAGRRAVRGPARGGRAVRHGGHRGAGRRWRCREARVAVDVHAKPAGPERCRPRWSAASGSRSGRTASTRWSCCCGRTPARRRCRSQRGASGGELSRVMLADRGGLRRRRPGADVGLRRGRRGGRRSGRGRGRPPAGPAGPDRQVLVVTHLPQVAAFADRHLVVEKADRRAR